ncbi:MAG TPA: hypothetical protein VGA70_07445 [Longimicrobiales bacterium]|jgi:transketolase
MSAGFGPRRGVDIDITERGIPDLSAAARDRWEAFDQVYRSLCAILFNYAPLSGHPGGSISSGRFVATLLFGGMDYDVARPDRSDADQVVYAAGHKALGLYAMWALRDEIARLGAPDLLPSDPAERLRLEDLLGFRRNPTNRTPLYLEFGAKALDGHPTPATPFVPVATGASGVGMASSVGLAIAMADTFGVGGPRIHIVEGEGGLTPGRVSEALAAAGTASLGNAVVHLDWNQSSIDSDRVCREGDVPGDYVQWTPGELFFLHDWNVIHVPDGTDFAQILAAQALARELDTGQPTAIVYRTTKGWRYGIEGRKSHGGGHALCSAEFFQSLVPLLAPGPEGLPSCPPHDTRCRSGSDHAQVERCYWTALQHVRAALAGQTPVVEALAGDLRRAVERLDASGRRPRSDAPDVGAAFRSAEGAVDAPPPDGLALEPGSSVPLRTQLGRVLGHLNRASGGAVIVAAADLLDSTAVSDGAAGFPKGYFNAHANPGSRTLSAGGIAEDAMCGILSGLSSFGRHIGVGSSYGAFIAPLGHISARLHAIGCQAREAVRGEPYRPFVLVCGHAGLKTGEDGPTHADPQALQLLQENFAPGTMITLTPWEPSEIWYLVAAGLAARPAVLAPFVTRPSEPVLDREGLGLAPARDAARGVYLLRAARGERHGTVVLQGSGVTYAFVRETLPLLEREGIDVDVFHVSSVELFDTLDEATRREVFPEERALEAMGVTGFTLPTLYRWVRSDRGLRHSVFPFRRGHYLGSGPGPEVIHEAGLDGEGQLRAVTAYVNELARIPAGVGG